MYISTVHLTRGFRVKRASGDLRRAPAPVQLRGGIRSIFAYIHRVALCQPGRAESRVVPRLGCRMGEIRCRSKGQRTNGSALNDSFTEQKFIDQWTNTSVS